MRKHRILFAIFAAIIIAAPALPVAAAGSGKGLDIGRNRVASVLANCAGFTISANVDESTSAVFSAWLDPDGPATQVRCTSGFCSGSNFVLNVVGPSSRTFAWSQTDLAPGTQCAPHTLRVVMVNDPTQHNEITFGGEGCCDPTGMIVTASALSAGGGGVEVRWSTEHEGDNLGFHIYRSLNDQIESAVLLDRELIPSQSSGAEGGAAYEYLDSSAQPYISYYYWLGGVRVSGGWGDGIDTDVSYGIYPLGHVSWDTPTCRDVVPRAGEIGGTWTVFSE